MFIVAKQQHTAVAHAVAHTVAHTVAHAVAYTVAHAVAHAVRHAVAHVVAHSCSTRWTHMGYATRYAAESVQHGSGIAGTPARTR